MCLGLRGQLETMKYVITLSHSAYYFEHGSMDNLDLTLFDFEVPGIEGMLALPIMEHIFKEMKPPRYIPFYFI